MVNFDNYLPKTAIMYTMQFAHLNSAFNPILYGLFNPAYQKGYKRFICKILNRKTEIGSQQNRDIKLTRVHVIEKT